MSENQSLNIIDHIIEINEQPYQIVIIKEDDNLNITATSSITKNIFVCTLDNDEIKSLTSEADFLRDLDQFYDLLKNLNDIGQRISLMGKLNTQNNILILSLKWKLGISNINDSVLFVIELTKIHKEDMVRFEEMIMDIYKNNNHTHSLQKKMEDKLALCTKNFSLIVNEEVSNFTKRILTPRDFSSIVKDEISVSSNELKLLIHNFVKQVLTIDDFTLAIRKEISISCDEIKDEMHEINKDEINNFRQHILTMVDSTTSFSWGSLLVAMINSIILIMLFYKLSL